MAYLLLVVLMCSKSRYRDTYRVLYHIKLWYKRYVSYRFKENDTQH